MNVSVSVVGASAVRKRLNNMAKASESKDVLIGYTANYALWVHEMVGATFQRPGAEAKFLEKALRRVKPRVAGLIKQHLGSGVTFAQALYMAGLLVQRHSQEIVPVDTGHLRGSAFTRFAR